MKFIFRACIGMFLIYGINLFLKNEGVAVSVGMNLWTFFTTGFLGIPGVALLYGIVIFQFL